MQNEFYVSTEARFLTIMNRRVHITQKVGSWLFDKASLCKPFNAMNYLYIRKTTLKWVVLMFKMSDKVVWNGIDLAHRCTIFLCYLGGDQYRNPNINDRDHLVGQLTRIDPTSSHYKVLPKKTNNGFPSQAPCRQAASGGGEDVFFNKFYF